MRSGTGSAEGWSLMERCRAPGPWPARLVTLAMACGLGLVACATSPPASFYTLRPLAAADGRGSTVGGGLGIGLGPVSFPAFLDQPQMIIRDPQNRLTLDEFNRWGGSLKDDFLRVLGENLGYLLGTSRILIFPSEVRYPLDFRVSADVLTFEGTAGGEAVLKVRWAVLDPRLEHALAVKEGTYRRPLAPPGDRAALTAALSGALGAFSEDLAETLRALPKPAPPPAAVPLY